MRNLYGLDSLSEVLLEEKLRQRHVHGFLVVDENALPLASTFYNRAFEEQLCGLSGKVLNVFVQARQDLGLSLYSYLWLGGVERHLAVIPLGKGLFLVAVLEAAAEPGSLLVPLFAFAQRLALRTFVPQEGN